MKIIFVFSLILMIRESLSCSIYLDLKSNHISDGIIVHYGRYSTSGRYQMYIGKEKGIECVLYGRGTLYKKKKKEIDRQVVVEVFENMLSRYFVILAITGSVSYHTDLKRMYYTYSDAGYISIDRNTFMSDMKDEIELLFDVSNKEMHPYMNMTVEYKNYYSEKFTMSKKIGDMVLDGIDAPEYKYGLVYDSKMLIKMGYSSLEAFVRRCESFTIEYRMFGDKITFETPNGILEYRVMNLMSQLVWDAQINEYVKVTEADHIGAISLQMKLDERIDPYNPIILDISENVSPELFGIEKVTGNVGNGQYVIYQMKKEYAGHYKIKTIIDTRADYMEIFEVDETFVFSSVEVFSNRYRKIVVINSVVKEGNSLVGRKEVFKLSKGQENYYKKLVGTTKGMVYAGLEKNYPIKLNLYVDNRVTSLYESVETIKENGNFIIFHIKETNGRGMRYLYKYLFGNVYERRKYKVGNIPEEPFGKNYEVIKRDIYQTDVIVVRSESELKLEGEDHSTYNFVSAW